MMIMMMMMMMMMRMMMVTPLQNHKENSQIVAIAVVPSPLTYAVVAIGVIAFGVIAGHHPLLSHCDFEIISKSQ